MSVLIRTDDERDWQVSPNVNGDDHDKCVSCDTDVEPIEHFGGEHGTPLMWQQYNHDRKAGGCGATWTRTTAQGLERNTTRDQQTKWLTGAASTERRYFTPSEAYRSNYQRVFGHE